VIWSNLDKLQKFTTPYFRKLLQITKKTAYFLSVAALITFMVIMAVKLIIGPSLTAHGWICMKWNM